MTDDVYELFKRQGLMVHRAQRRLARHPHEIGGRLCLAHLQADGQGVHEETDQILGARLRSIGDRGAHHQILLLTPLRQHRGKRREQHHVRRRLLCTSELLQFVPQTTTEPRLQNRALIPLASATRMIERKRECRRCALKCRAPELCQLVECVALQHLTLPCGKVRVLEGQRRLLNSSATHPRGVGRAKVSNQHAGRPAVRDGVMLYHAECPLVWSGLGQHRTHQRAGLERERCREHGLDVA